MKVAKIALDTVIRDAREKGSRDKAYPVLTTLKEIGKRLGYLGFAWRDVTHALLPHYDALSRGWYPLMEGMGHVYRAWFSATLELNRGIWPKDSEW